MPTVVGGIDGTVTMLAMLTDSITDNAAVLEGHPGSFLAPNVSTGEWRQVKENVDYLAKVETHNHPTAV